jgi:HEAT repeat protein
MLDDEDPTVQLAAVGVLTVSPNPDAVGRLLKLLSADYPPTNAAARAALVAAGGGADLDASGGNPGGAAAGAPDVIAGCAAMLNNSNPRRREDASYILGRLKSDAALSRHIQLLNDPDMAVATQAAESLGLIGRPEAGEAVGESLRRAVDASAGAGGQNFSLLRIGCFVAAGRLGYRAALPIAERVAAISPGAMDPLVSARAAATFAIGRLADASEAGRLLRRVRDQNEDAEVVLESIKALANLRAMSALPALQAIADEGPVPEYRRMAYLAVCRLTGRTPAPAAPPHKAQPAATSITDMSGADSP